MLQNFNAFITLSEVDICVRIPVTPIFCVRVLYLSFIYLFFACYRFDWFIDKNPSGESQRTLVKQALMSTSAHQEPYRGKCMHEIRNDFQGRFLRRAVILN